MPSDPIGYRVRLHYTYGLFVISEDKQGRALDRLYREFHRCLARGRPFRGLVVDMAVPRVLADVMLGSEILERVCRVCGCFDHDACQPGDEDGPCAWAEADLCTACVGQEAADA